MTLVVCVRGNEQVTNGMSDFLAAAQRINEVAQISRRCEQSGLRAKGHNFAHGLVKSRVTRDECIIAKIRIGNFLEGPLAFLGKRVGNG